jgi:XTP/dITP diphosphohydrolase
MRIVLATANVDKAAEITELVRGRCELLPRPPEVADVAETESTLEGNARLKAVALADATGLAALADDTGLEVKALGGAPGVHAARYAGEHATYGDNVEKLLREMEGVADRSARFRTVIVVAFPDGRELLAEGATDGVIASAPRGARGFGYDPVFIPRDGDGRTFAEMSADEKHAVSHRSRAVEAVLDQLLTNRGGR